jgi:very-short-patch-repair endonuclease
MMGVPDQKLDSYPHQGQFTSEDLKRRGLIFNGRHLPYNPNLLSRARELRKNMTPAERKLWTSFLRTFPCRVPTQRPIDNYIVDFYCPAWGLVIEIDGEQHYTEAGKTYDAERDGILAGYGLKILRVTNREVMECFPEVCRRIRRYLPH